MKQTEIDRLKAICEKEGFHFDWDHVDHSAIIIREKKDPWEGVEFIVGFLGIIYKVAKTDSDGIHTSCGKFTWWDAVKKNYKPSTESAYIEQLKKEAFERFGEIKDGDRFDRSEMNFKVRQSKDYICDAINGFKYHKEFDQLQFGNLSIYCEGKWAKKLPERVKVEWLDWNWVNYSHDIINQEFELKNINWDKVQNKDDIGEYLAKALEDYLNKEAGLI